MNISIETKINVEMTCHSHNGIIKTHSCDIGEWYSDEICEMVDFNRELGNIQLPEGKYKVNISFEMVDDN